jgi:hypothetical protein
MADKNIDHTNPECPGLIFMKNTDKDIRDIRKSIEMLANASTANASNLKSIAGTLKALQLDNSQTHYKLFSRTEETRIELEHVKTKHDEHVKNEDKEDAHNHQRHSFAVSIFAVIISVITVGVLVATIIYK